MGAEHQAIQVPAHQLHSRGDVVAQGVQGSIGDGLQGRTEALALGLGSSWREVSLGTVCGWLGICRNGSTGITDEEARRVRGREKGEFRETHLVVDQSDTSLE